MTCKIRLETVSQKLAELALHGEKESTINVIKNLYPIRKMPCQNTDHLCWKLLTIPIKKLNVIT